MPSAAVTPLHVAVPCHHVELLGNPGVKALKVVCETQKELLNFYLKEYKLISLIKGRFPGSIH